MLQATSNAVALTMAHKSQFGKRNFRDGTGVEIMRISVLSVPVPVHIQSYGLTVKASLIR